MTASERNCDQCGASYAVPHWRLTGPNASRYCSRKCAAIARFNAQGTKMEPHTSAPSETPAAPALDASAKTRSRTHVTVACKWGPGILMQAHKMVDGYEPVLGGGSREIKRAVPVHMEPIKINGPHLRWGEQPAFMMAGGYALTHNVPADIADAWFDANKDSPLVRNHIIKICDDSARAKSECNEYEGTRSGIERLDVGIEFRNNQPVQKDPRWPKATRPGNLTGVQTADKQ